MAVPQGFADWPRQQQLEYIYSTYGGTIEDRKRATGTRNVTTSPRFRAHNVATADYVSPEERELWGLVKPDSGTFAGRTLSDLAGPALAAGLLAAGGTALMGGGGAAGAGAGSNLGIFANGGTAGMAGVGGGAAGSLAASGAIAGGAGAAGLAGLGGLGSLVGGGGAAGGTGMGWLDVLLDVGPDIAGALLGHDAAGDAADAQAAGARDVIAENRRQYDQTREDFAPYREAGAGAIGQLQTATQPGGEFNRDFTMADFVKDPGYQFRMDEGSRALQGANAATVGVQNGRTGRELTRYGQDYASGEFGNAYNRFNNDRSSRFNRLASLAGVGQTASGTVATAGQNMTNNVSDATIGAANARAAGRVGEANALVGGVESLGNWYRNRRYGGQPSNYGVG